MAMTIEQAGDKFLLTFPIDKWGSERMKPLEPFAVEMFNELPMFPKVYHYRVDEFALKVVCDAHKLVDLNTYLFSQNTSTKNIYAAHEKLCIWQYEFLNATKKFKTESHFVMFGPNFGSIKINESGSILTLNFNDITFRDIKSISTMYSMFSSLIDMSLKTTFMSEASILSRQESENKIEELKAKYELKLSEKDRRHEHNLMRKDFEIKNSIQKNVIKEVLGEAQYEFHFGE